MTNNSPAKNEWQHVFNRDVIFVSSQSTVRATIELMIKRQVSSVLVHNDLDEIVGIFTERDVVRKFTLLENQSKLDAKINTVMTRPVIYADQEDLEQSVIRLHQTYGFRHFPVRTKGGSHIRELVGILTVTDIFRSWSAQSRQSQTLQTVYLLCGDSNFTTTLQRFLAVHGIIATPARHKEATTTLIERALRDHAFVIYDMDFFTVEENLQYLGRAKQGKLILMTSHEKLIKPYRDHLDPSRQHIFLKPLDVSYLCWLLERDQSYQKTS